MIAPDAPTTRIHWQTFTPDLCVAYTDHLWSDLVDVGIGK